MLEIALRNPEPVRQDARRSDGRRCRRRRQDRRGAHRTPATSRRRTDTSSRENDVVLAVGPSKEALEQAQQEPRRSGARARCSRTAATSTTCACSPRRPSVVGRALGDLELPGQDRTSVMPKSAAATPTSCRGPTWCSSSATASACSPIATTSPALRQVLRRLDQGHGRVQLHLDRPGHGARLPARRDPDPAARRSASSRSASSGVLIVALILGKHAAHRRHELDDPAVGQPGAAQPRAHAVPGAGRHVVRAEVRRHRDARAAC